MIYAAGNFIECTTDTPYLQIGEHKYGKPVLDRAIHYDIDLYDALKIGLVSVDSTMRSNLSVGMPLDVLVARRDACEAELNLPHRAGRALFPRPARALVGGAARRPQQHSAPALRDEEMNRRVTSSLPCPTTPRTLSDFALGAIGRNAITNLCPVARA